MTERMRVAIAASGGAGVILLALAFLYWVVFWPGHKLQRDAQSLVGKTEAAVVAKMGAPYKVVTASDVATRPSEAWWLASWHPAPTFPVKNKVLLYYGTWMGALVYISPIGIVEHVHLIST